MPPRRARPKGPADRESEQAILRATDDLLRVKPLPELAVGEILASAGVSRATFYFYFESKYDAVGALFRSILEEVFVAFRENWTGIDGGDPEPALRKALTASYKLFVRHAALLRAVADASGEPQVATAFHEMIARLIETAAEKIDRDRAAGAAPPGLDSHALAAAMIWMNERCFYFDSLEGASSWRSSAQMVDALSAVWAGAVYGHVAQPRSRRRRSTLVR